MEGRGYVTRMLFLQSPHDELSTPSNLKGIRGFYKGYLYSLLVYIPFSLAFFSTYEALHKRDHSIPVSAAAGGITGGVVSKLLDVCKTRKQASLGKAGVVSPDKRALFTPISRIEIWTALDREVSQVKMNWLWRGMVPRVLWLCPSVVISMTLFETLRDKDEE